VQKFNRGKRNETSSNNNSNRKSYNKNNKRKDRGPPRIKGRHVAPYDGESTEHLIKRFRRVVESSGVMRELKKREYYLSKSQKKREKQKRALKRLRKRERMMGNGNED